MRADALKSLCFVPFRSQRFSEFFFRVHHRNAHQTPVANAATAEFTAEYSGERVHFGAAEIVDSHLSRVETCSRTRHTDDGNIAL